MELPDRFIRRGTRAATVVLVLAVSTAGAASAQQGTTVSGRLIDTITLEPIAGATVVIEELKRETTSGSDATFAFENVPPGEYHLLVRAEGHSSRRTEVVVGATPVTVELAVDPELHYTEVVSVGPAPRSAFEAYQPTSVLSGQELAKQLGSSLGETLEHQPGLASRSLGPAPSRPVIRGLDGDRVLILEDGQRVGDISSQSADHGVPVNPAAATRIEVVRGPATLLYGANAIGGLVNVISNQIPPSPTTGVEGSVISEFGTGARQGGIAGDVLWGNGRWAAHGGGAARASGDVRTPDGAIDNSQSRSGSINGALSWTSARVYIGGSYGYDDTKYGVPVVEEGEIELTPRRHQFTLRSGGKDLEGLLQSYRATVGVRRYRHEELEGTEVGTTFINNTLDVEFLGGHRRAGRLTGSLGFFAGRRAFEATGAEALSPPVDQNTLAVFAYEEVTWPHITAQFGARAEWADYDPQRDRPARDFSNVSGSLGLLYRPAFARDAITVAASLARAARNPALEELYFFGEHPGNFAFEIGNPDLESEVGLGFDLSLRWQARRISGEVTYFRNDIRDFIFRNPLTETEIEQVLGHEFEDEHGSGEEEIAVIRFEAADSVLSGFEAHTDVLVARGLTAELGIDFVRGTNKELDAPLPRMPPFRVRTGLRYQRDALQVGGEVIAADRQDRVFGAETPTAGYGLSKIFAAYSWPTAGAVSTLTARLDNATNTRYLNHLSYIKEFVPEMGRSFKLVYSLAF